MKIKKDYIIYGIIIAVILIIIFTINFLKADDTLTDNQASCIAQNSILVLSKTCSHCANQKDILNIHLDKFNVAYIDENPNLPLQYGIKQVPAWIINGDVYTGVKTTKELKKLSDC